MKIIRLDRTGHTETQVETMDEAIAEIERSMNLGLTALVEKENGDAIRLGKSTDIRQHSMSESVMILPHLTGGIDLLR